MIYNPQTQTLIRVTMDDVSDAELRELAAMKGTTSEGRPVLQVALVFVMGQAHAQQHLEAIARYGLECRAVIAGQERVLSLDAGEAAAQGTPALVRGELVPVLREEGWPNISAVVNRRLIVGVAATGPWVTFARDLGDAIRSVDPKSLGTGTIPGTPDELERQALDNLAKREFTVESTRAGSSVSVLHEYGSEAVLLKDVMSRVHTMVGSPVVAVAMPKEGGFLAVDLNKAGEVAALAAWARKTFEEATGARRISPLPLLVRDGKIIGFAQVQGNELPPGVSGDKPWWRFW